MPTKPWVEGPLELLKHGLEYLELGNDFDTRIAMISIDNAVELMIKTYLGLPRRATGITELTRQRYEQLSQSFSSLLDGLEEFALDKLVGVELGDIEWYHRLRNQLYHQGNGITVERGKVEGYAEIAKILFSNLFEVTTEELLKEKPRSSVGEFINNWALLEQELIRLMNKTHIGAINKSMVSHEMAVLLRNEGILPSSFLIEFFLVQKFRMDVIHGGLTPSENDLRAHTDRVKKLLATTSKL